MRMRQWCVLFLVFLVSCAPRREGILLDTGRTSAAELTSMTDSADARLRTLNGNGNIAFESPEINGSAAFTLNVRKPDSLLVQLEGPFGIDVGLFFLSRDRFVMYNSLQNTVIAGAPSTQALRSLIPVDLSYEQIFAVFTGLLRLPEHQTLVEYTVDDGQFLLRYKSKGGVNSYWLDPDGLLVRRFEMRDQEGELVLEGASTGTIDQDGLRIARRLSLTMPREGRRVSVAFYHADLNASDLEFSYSIPASARKIDR